MSVRDLYNFDRELGAIMKYISFCWYSADWKLFREFGESKDICEMIRCRSCTSGKILDGVIYLMILFASVITGLVCWMNDGGVGNPYVHKWVEAMSVFWCEGNAFHCKI